MCTSIRRSALSQLEAPAQHGNASMAVCNRCFRIYLYGLEVRPKGRSKVLFSLAMLLEAGWGDLCERALLSGT